jgi:hypothetical protein
MASRGTLTIDWMPVPVEDSPARLSLITIALVGTSSDLIGNYTGYWNRDDDTPCGTDTTTPTEQVQGVMTLSRS